MDEVEVYDHYDKVNEAAEWMLRGHSPTEIARRMNVKRALVVEYLDEWKSIARNASQIQERSKDAVSGADQHYSMIISRLWENIEQADSAGELKVAQTGLTAVANVEEKRINMLQKAGLLDNQNLAEQLAERERRDMAIVELLRNVAKQHPAVRHMIIEGLNKLNGGGEGVTAIEQ